VAGEADVANDDSQAKPNKPVIGRPPVEDGKEAVLAWALKFLDGVIGEPPPEENGEQPADGEQPDR